jgi:hypothetical protein
MDKQPLGADAPLDDADLLMPSPAVCRAMAQFHLALAQKAMATHNVYAKQRCGWELPGEKV